MEIRRKYIPMGKKPEYGEVYDFDLGGNEVKGIYVGRLSPNKTMSFEDVIIFRSNGKIYAYRFGYFKINESKLQPLEIALLKFRNNLEEEYANKLLVKAGL